MGENFSCVELSINFRLQSSLPPPSINTHPFTFTLIFHGDLLSNHKNHSTIIIIIIILIHYHKRLTCHRIESAYRFIGLVFSLRFLFLHSVSCMYIQLCKAIKKNSQPGAGERGGGTGVTCRLCVFMKRMCGGRRPRKDDFQRQWSPWNGYHQGGVRDTSRR